MEFFKTVSVILFYMVTYFRESLASMNGGGGDPKEKPTEPAKDASVKPAGNPGMQNHTGPASSGARAEGCRGDNARAGADSAKAESCRGDKARADSAKAGADSAKAESCRGDSARADSAKAGSCRGDSAKADKARADSARAGGHNHGNCPYHGQC
ncbi:hypothetical protein CWI37_1222p0010 [Hamiltosporidium tvaerminnensis]|uniref:Uncharacterized protein n=1 Tax=Hamiltosporidium tvaerminnensis TaxID=1176355 RepID=A0A4Q9KXW1_9MICR|nr:hypothetical protein LUQ84_003394 [Hamiltosporidium tvaerminnensis]TBT99773.1 hypothetical protein CWI37_1222p0010 [Hamiltosporidium tvaerminnensis]